MSTALQKPTRGRIERIEWLVRRLLSVVNNISPQQGTLVGLQADGIRRTVITLKTGLSAPYFIQVTLEARDQVTKLNYWQRAHVLIIGDAALPVQQPSGGGGDFTQAQAGYANTPSLFVTIPGGGPTIQLQVSNPAANVNLIDVKITIDTFDIGPIS